MQVDREDEEDDEKDDDNEVGDSLVGDILSNWRLIVGGLVLALAAYILGPLLGRAPGRATRRSAPRPPSRPTPPPGSRYRGVVHLPLLGYQSVAIRILSETGAPGWRVDDELCERRAQQMVRSLRSLLAALAALVAPAPRALGAGVCTRGTRAREAGGTLGGLAGCRVAYHAANADPPTARAARVNPGAGFWIGRGV